jgi:hypothetical protein
MGHFSEFAKSDWGATVGELINWNTGRTLLDVTGERYGRLIAIRLILRQRLATVWLWRCDCGVEVEAPLHDIRQNKKRSCGCLYRETRRRNPKASRRTGARLLEYLDRVGA